MARLKKFNHPVILKITFLKDYKIIAEFRDGSVKIYNFKPLLKKEPFSLLQSTTLFANGKIDAGGYGISWTDTIDIDAYDIWVAGKDITEQDIKNNSLHKN